MRLNSLLTAVWVIGLATAPLDAQSPSTSGPPHVETVGKGTRRVAPDRANVHLTVETVAATAAGAAAENARTVAAVIDTLRLANLDSAVTTSSYQVDDNWEPSGADTTNRAQRRYAARTILRVRLLRIDNVGRVIDVGLSKGATGVQNVTFESSRAEEEQRSALAEAAASARREAEVLARALGGSLGRLLSVTTTPTDEMRYAVYLESSAYAAPQATSLGPNNILITTAVVTRWQFVARPR